VQILARALSDRENWYSMNLAGRPAIVYLLVLAGITLATRR
jgi:hypothetical protein